MEFVGFIILLAMVFAVCFGIDKGFAHIFRNQAQHHSGMAVRLNKKYGAFGVLMIVLGLASVMSGLRGEKSTLMIVAGVVVALVGVMLIVYYMTSAIFYDEDAFIFTSFGKKQRRYPYREIKAQQLYNASGNIVVELHMTDGSTVTVQSAMNGAYDFLDFAFSAWCRQCGIQQESCSFHDPANSCWFPPVQEDA